MPHRRIHQFLLVYAAGLSGLFALKYGMNLSDYVIPGPKEVLATGREVFARYLASSLDTFSVAVTGHVLSICLAAFVAVVGKFAGWFGALIKTAAFNIQAYPIVAIAPIVFLLMGDGLASRLLIASMICYFPLLLSVLGVVTQPVEDIEHFYRMTGKMNWRLEVKIRMFENISKLTTVVTGSATLAMVGAIVAEFIAADAGIGYTMRIALYQSDLAKILVALFLVGVFVSLYLAFLEWLGHVLEKRWNR